METGSRKEMVRNEGFRLESLRRWADRQSMNSVESCPAQNSRSSSSDRNSGKLFFVLGIGISLLSVHGNTSPPGPSRCSSLASAATPSGTGPSTAGASIATGGAVFISRCT